MGKALALAAVTFIALGTYYNGVRSASELDTRRRVSNNQYEALSRSAALAGINVAKQALAEGWKPTVIRGEHQGGAYTVQIKANKKRATIESVGTIKNAGRHSENYLVSVIIERRQVLPATPPSWMQYALATDADIKLTGDPSITLAMGSPDGLNANVHTNGTMELGGKKLEILGFGSYSTSVIGKESALESFQPPYNPTGQDHLYETDPIDIPDFTDVDYANYLDAYGESIVDQSSVGDVEVGGLLDLGGTRDNPYVWHVDGNLRFTSDTVINGYVMFVVTGETSMSGDVLVGDSGFTGGAESSVALYTNGNLNLSGNSTVNAQMFVGGQAVVAKGTPTILGNLVTNGGIDMRGTPNMLYRQASSALTSFWQPYEYTFHINGYNEQ